LEHKQRELVDPTSVFKGLSMQARPNNEITNDKHLFTIDAGVVGVFLGIEIRPEKFQRPRMMRTSGVHSKRVDEVQYHPNINTAPFDPTSSQMSKNLAANPEVGPT
jgi:hypothetical protein